jgi:hypothetical protein
LEDRWDVLEHDGLTAESAADAIVDVKPTPRPVASNNRVSSAGRAQFEIQQGAGSGI